MNHVRPSLFALLGILMPLAACTGSSVSGNDAGTDSGLPGTTDTDAGGIDAGGIEESETSADPKCQYIDNVGSAVDYYAPTPDAPPALGPAATTLQPGTYVLVDSKEYNQPKPSDATTAAVMLMTLKVAAGVVYGAETFTIRGATDRYQDTSTWSISTDGKLVTQRVCSGFTDFHDTITTTAEGFQLSDFSEPPGEALRGPFVNTFKRVVP